MTTSSKPQPTTPKKTRPKLRKFAAGLAMGLILNTASPIVMGRNEVRNKILHQQPQSTLTETDAYAAVYESAKINTYLESFGKYMLQSRVSPAERDMLARMVYGEAGRGADIFEVIHTVLNRMSSPLFGNTVSAVVTPKNQFVGYSPKHPVDPALRQMVDFVVDEWEANGCKPIQNCNHYYFVTGITGVCNKFEISPDGKGAWVPAGKKQYAPLRHYCDVATDQYARFKNQPAPEPTR